MREVSATEASRNFSAVLDSAEQGETILVTRAGDPVATIAPAPRANGAHLLELFARQASAVPADAVQAHADDEVLADTVANVDQIARADLDNDPWRD